MENNCPPNAKELHEELWASLARRVYSSPHDINCLTPDERTVFAVRLFQAEVYNGGIDQFFYNSSGDYFTHVVIGLKALGAHQTCELLTISTRILFSGKAPSPHRDDRSHVMFTRHAVRCYDALEALETAMDDTTDNVSAKLAAFTTEKGLLAARSTTQT